MTVVSNMVVLWHVLQNKKCGLTTTTFSPTPDEKPRFDKTIQEQLRTDNEPQPAEEVQELEEELEDFCKDVKIILHTVDENEYDAATTFLKPPSDKFKKTVEYSDFEVIGVFAGIKVALIKTEAGLKCREYIREVLGTYPNIDFIIGVGVGHAFSKEECSLGDVLVAKRICTSSDCPFDTTESDGVDVVFELSKMFCNKPKFPSYAVSAADRASKVHCGTICSYRTLFNNDEKRSKPVEGKMEGSVLMEFQQNKEFKGAIIVQGVADYGDGSKAKQWQFTAAMAALRYIENKLESSKYGSMCKLEQYASGTL